MSAGHTESSSASPEDLLILVHGTYAARESGDGDTWWQNGGSLSAELKGRLLGRRAVARRSRGLSVVGRE